MSLGVVVALYTFRNLVLLASMRALPVVDASNKHLGKVEDTLRKAVALESGHAA